MHILIVEDERALCDTIARSLRRLAYSVDCCYDGQSAAEMLAVERFDLVVLDLNLPGEDGMTVLRTLRERDRDTKVLILSARCEVADKVAGLDAGANDYLTKPFEMKELLARINAVLRRSEIPEDTHKRLTFDKLIIDLDSYELIVDGKKIDTPPKELELLYHLAATPNRVYTRNQLLDEVWGFDYSHPGMVFTREQLLEQVWGYDYFGDSRTVDVHVKRLREKVENVSDQWALKTVWGVGYKFEVK